MNIETQTIDKLFLELSQVSQAKTARELALESELENLRAKGRTIDTVMQVIECLEHVERDATMENSVFDLFWEDPKNPLPTRELEVNAFIRRRTQLWRDTWVLSPTRQALKLLRQSIER